MKGSVILRLFLFSPPQQKTDLYALCSEWNHDIIWNGDET